MLAEDTTIPHALNETEETLVRQSLGGQRAAFSVLASRYQTVITALAFRALGSADDAQDVAQETLLYAYQRLGDLREPARFGPWLKSVALSLCADFRRGKATRPLAPLDPWHAETIVASERNLAESLVLRDALARLSARHRLTFTLAHVGGYAHAEIASLLDIPAATVRSRLQTAKRLLRADLAAIFPERKTMPATKNAESANNTLPAVYENLIRSAYPDARVVAAQHNPETWMPFAWRVRLALPNEGERSVDVRTFNQSGNPDGAVQIRLLAALKRLGLPTPDLLAGPLPDPKNKESLLVLTATPTGENLLLWALEGNLPHRIRAATNLAIAAIDQLHGLTDGLLADPVGRDLPRRPLSTDLAEIVERGGPWMNDSLFAGAVKRLAPLVAQIAESTPLVYTNGLYFPNFLRVTGDTKDFSAAAPFGWPGDPRGDAGRQITQFVAPFGWLGDPILGLAKFWTYDCYPFVHTGLVERYLYEKGISRAEFAPRLAVRALWTLQGELPVERPAEGSGYWDSLVGLLQHALASLD